MLRLLLLRRRRLQQHSRAAVEAEVEAEVEAVQLFKEEEIVAAAVAAVGFLARAAVAAEVEGRRVGDGGPTDSELRR